MVEPRQAPVSGVAVSGVAVWAMAGRGRTGSFVGWGSTLRSDVVILHPAASAVAADGSSRVRVRLADELVGIDVIDGIVTPSRPGKASGLAAVNLDFATRYPVTLTSLPLLPSASDIQRLVDEVEQAAQSDPSQPPPKPTRPGHTPPGNHHPGLTPPWCAIWPHAWGCD